MIDKFTDFFKRVTRKGISKEELQRGIDVELEHIADDKKDIPQGRKIAEMIALQHLNEDPNYYSQLAKIHKE